METTEPTYSNDRPIFHQPQDRLGFGEMATHLAQAFLYNDLSDGFVVGVEGKWGSGKSSLANLAMDRLRQGDGQVGVVEFQPWLVGERDDLLRELFHLLASEVERLGGQAKDHAADGLRQFSRLASATSKVFLGLAEVGVPVAKLFGDLAKGGHELAEAAAAPESLGTVKEAAKLSLQELGKPIVVFIDDLDRLDPREAVEVLRLVRAVADFPNVAYLLAYDADVVSHNLESALGISDGRAYLEKIVQVSFRVPQADSFDLGKWFADETRKIFRNARSNGAADTRLAEALFVLPHRFLETPRDVIRVLNALRLYATPVADKTDPADQVFLQILRLKRPDLYNWVEKYVERINSVRNGNSLRPGEGADAGNKLLAMLGQTEEEQRHLLWLLRDHLPGLPLSPAQPFDAYQNLRQSSNRTAIQDRRLFSPQHYRHYFAFGTPSGAMSENDVEAFINLAQGNPSEAEGEFARLCEALRPQGRTMALWLVNHLAHIGSKLEAEKIASVLTALGPGMDRVFAISDQDDQIILNGDPGSLFGLIQRLSPADRQKFLPLFFTSCPSLAWLTSIIRSSIFDHGVFGHQARTDEERLLSRAEYDEVWEIFRSRLNDASPRDLLSTPKLIQTLYAWLQGGAEQEVRAWVRNCAASEEDLVRLLEGMQGYVQSTAGSYFVVSRRDLEMFFEDADGISLQISNLANGKSPLSDKASALSIAIQKGAR